MILKKNSIIFLLVCLIFICGVHFVRAYDIQFQSQATAEYVNFNSQYMLSNHIIQNNGNLNSYIIFDLGVTYTNFSLVHPDVTIYFNPYENYYTHPAENVFILICEGFKSNSIDFYSTNCGENNTEVMFSQENKSTELAYIHENKIEGNNIMYYMTFSPKSFSSRYFVIIRYTTPSFVYTQGDYKVASITFPDLPNKQNYMNYIYLPSANDVPIFLPEATQSSIVPMNTNGGIQTSVALINANLKLSNNWGYRFDTPGTKSIWYEDVKQIKNDTFKYQIYFLIAGAILGGILSPFLAYVIRVIVLFWKKQKKSKKYKSQSKKK